MPMKRMTRDSFLTSKIEEYFPKNIEKHEMYYFQN